MELLGESKGVTGAINEQIIQQGVILSDDDRRGLSSLVTAEEVKKVVFSIPEDVLVQMGFILDSTGDLGI